MANTTSKTPPQLWRHKSQLNDALRVLVHRNCAAEPPYHTHTFTNTHTHFKFVSIQTFRLGSRTNQSTSAYVLIKHFSINHGTRRYSTADCVALFFFKFIIIIILVSLNLWRLYYNANFLNQLTQTQNLTRHLSFSKQVSKREVQKWPRQKVKVTIP